MPAGLRTLTLTIALLLAAGGARAARVDVELEGINEEMREAVRAALELNDYGKRDISRAELRSAFKDADGQIKQALEPFGYYEPKVDKQLTGDAENGWKAKFVVAPGAPAIVRNARVEVLGDGKDQRRVRNAIEGFVPKVGERLDHASYEASKAVIDSSLRGSGYLDAKITHRRVTVRPEDESADVDLAWESGERYKFGDVRFTGDAPFPDGFLRDFVPWKEGAYFNSEQVLNLQQRLVDADYFALVSVQPALDEKKDGAVPIDVLLNRDERTVYSGEVYYSTDFGAGVRVGAARRWLNKKGHKADVQAEYSERLQETAVHYGIPRPGREDRSYDFGIAYRDETTDVSRSRNFQLAASRSEKRWHGFTRTIGLKYLRGDFELGRDEDNLEFGSSKLLFAEGSLSRRRVNDRLSPRKGYVVDFGVRLGSEAVLADTDLAQTWGRLTWLIPQGDKARIKLRGEVGAMTVGNFDALPPDLRFFAGGDRSVRGFDYHEIGEVNARGIVIGGKYLAVASAEYEFYFRDDWGAAVFVDAGDAFSDSLSLNVGTGVGLRWRSPVGPIRLDVGFPVRSTLPVQDSWRLHIQLGPDL
ncbi:MAG TPA: outer membrane protein assembly factor [Steroidobacteraceae bacterium]|jgi:translocation and assembly module TamA|nr:outer membrane protein assembly factor [Steroidobacteraceae bacterium]